MYDCYGHACFDETQGVIDFDTYCTSSQLSYWADIVPPSSPSDSDIATAKELAITDAFAGVSEAVYLSGQDAAEARQTINMFVDYLRDAVRLLRNVRKLRINASGLSAKELSNQWLRYRYGLRPLMYSIKQTIDAVQAIGRPPRCTSRGFRRLSGSATTNLGTVNTTRGNWVAGAVFDVFGYHTRDVLVSAGVLFENTIRSMSYQQAFGLRVDDILPTAWELVPYSFVVDWFCNVGQIVRAWSPCSEGQILTSWVKVNRLDTVKLEFSNWRASPTYTEPDERLDRTGLDISMSDGSEVREYFTVTREARPERPVIPSVEIRLDMAKLLDILTLIRQLY